MNSVDKGRRNERKTAEFFRSLGFLVETTKRSSYKGGSNDFFGLYDHVILAPCDIVIETVVTDRLKNNRKVGNLFVPEQTTLLAQTKSNTFPKNTWEEMLAFPYQKTLGVLWIDRITTPVIIVHPYLTQQPYFLKHIITQRYDRPNAKYAARPK